MNEIKFNKNYKKLYDQTEARLLKVYSLDQTALSADFIDYDTDSGTIAPGHYYLLVFFGNKYIPFSTVRKFIPENRDKYCGREGETFKIVVEGENK